MDSQGNVYIASAGLSASPGSPTIDVFDAEHNYLTTISNANEPCGLAVDTKGDLYVSEQDTGNIVRYKPDAYPLTGSPTYGSAEPIDSSGIAKGIAVDPFDDRLYVAEGNHIAVYNPDGMSTATNEVQSVNVFEATGGTFKLTFEGQETPAISYNATAGEVEAVLEALSTIGAGNIEVEKPGSEYFITFTGALADTDVKALEADASGLTGGGSQAVFVGESTKGFNGGTGEGLIEATGVAAYTSEGGTSHLFAVDPAGGGPDRIQVFSGGEYKALKLRKTIEGVDQDGDPTTADQQIGFGVAGAYVAADRGKCPDFVQACTAGHFFVYDDAHAALDEFEASGEYLTQISNPGFSDAQPTAVAVDRSAGSGNGTLYVTSSASAGAKVRAFGALVPPSRLPRSDLSFTLKTARAVAVDAYGNRYVATSGGINIYPPASNTAMKTITDGNTVGDIAVDSACNVYSFDIHTETKDEEVVYFAPSACPPTPSTTYSAPTTVAKTGAPYFANKELIKGMGINPVTDHVYVNQLGETIELDSAKSGSGILDPSFASGLFTGTRGDVDAYGANGNVYFPESAPSAAIVVVDPNGEEVITRITGAGSPQGSPLKTRSSVAVDHANGHVVVFAGTRETAEEYDASGAFLAEFGSFSGTKPYKIAVDNSCTLHKPVLSNAECEAFDPSSGNVYVAFDGTPTESFDLTAFDPLVYGEPPIALTGAASDLGGGTATLNGSVDPRGFELTECKFEYLTDAKYLENGKTFAGATPKPCAESLAAIGKGTGPVAVHATITGLDPEGRYRFRLVAGNNYGTSRGEANLFGAPVITPRTALPISYTEATLRATIESSGLPTKYRFEYGTNGEYGQSTATAEIAPSASPTDVAVHIFGLTEGTTYDFRVFAENEVNSVLGSEQNLTTLVHRTEESCPNVEFHTGHSAGLPDCRAYELTTPADMRGLTPESHDAIGSNEFSSWVVDPSGEGAGGRLSFFVSGTLPGFDGSGFIDGYRSRRASGTHPSGGWGTELVSPSYAEAAPNFSNPLRAEGVASDQEYSVWGVGSAAGTLEEGAYLRTPAGFEAVGRGSMGTDPDAEGWYVSPGGSHVIFGSKAHLEDEEGNEAAPAGTDALYDRGAGKAIAKVISVTPDGTAFGAGANASFMGATEDGSVIAFEVGGVLYLHRLGKTVEVAAAPNTYAGISADGKRVFYIDAVLILSNPPAAGLHACDVAVGPCAGPEAHAPIDVASNSRFVNISADGTRVYFTSTDVLDVALKGTLGQNNLYLWDEGSGSIRFITPLDAEDLDPLGFEHLNDNLIRWLAAVGPKEQRNGRAYSTTRSTPDGAVLIFVSRGNLTAYDAEGHSEIYRYDATANGGAGELSCVSCDPTGAPPGADATLQSLRNGGFTNAPTIIPNVTSDGGAVFFESQDSLLPEDANSVQDIYEWQAQGARGCKRPGGCLALISSGQGDRNNFLYSMTPNGQDVFFATREKLVGSDTSGSPSIYDAREDGGIPDPPAPTPCQGDACQGQGSTTPTVPSAASAAPVRDGNVEVKPPLPCPKGKREVKRNGKARCVNTHRKRRHRKRRRANHNRRVHR